jgi:uracil phosphoribosyltransferase
MDLRGGEWSGKAAEERLHEVKITANRNTVPFDERPPMEASGVRLGTPAVTMRGFDEDDLREVGEVIAGALGPDPDLDALSGRSEALCEKRPLYPGFRGYTTVDEVTLLLTYEATKGLATEEIEIETPLERTTVQRISGKKVAVCPILRAGLGMLDGVLSLISGARVGFIGLYRNEETLQPVEYYVKLPADVAERDVILLDPMLATGNSTAAAVTTVKSAGATSVRLIAIIAAPEGIERLHSEHPDVNVVVAAVDRGLNEKGYIVPGLGDAGDRLFGTK